MNTIHTMITALRTSAKILVKLVEFDDTPTDPLLFDRTGVPETFIDRLIGHYGRQFDGSYVKAFEFPVVETPAFDALVRIARERGYYVTRPTDGLSVFACSIDEVEQLICQEAPDDNSDELRWLVDDRATTD